MSDVASGNCHRGFDILADVVVVLEGKSAAKTFGLALAIWKRSSFLSTSRKALPLANLFDWHQNSAPRGELSVAIW
jgi:hypothetical protein